MTPRVHIATARRSGTSSAATLSGGIQRSITTGPLVPAGAWCRCAMVALLMFGTFSTHENVLFVSSRVAVKSPFAVELFDFGGAVVEVGHGRFFGNG